MLVFCSNSGAFVVIFLAFFVCLFIIIFFATFTRKLTSYLTHIFSIIQNRGSRGRVVKAMDLKSIGVFPRRFESCRLRSSFLLLKQLSDVTVSDQEKRCNFKMYQEIIFLNNDIGIN